MRYAFAVCIAFFLLQGAVCTMPGTSFNSLKSDVHPDIAIQFSGINELSPENESNLLEMIISMAGVSRQFEIPCTIDTFSSDNVCISGNVTISFSEFSLDPPVMVLGLVRVEEYVDVMFQVNLQSRSGVDE